MVCGQALPILECFLTLTLGQRPQKIYVFVTSIINLFVLGLDILPALDASVDLGHKMLTLAEDYILLWSPEVGAEAGPQPFRLVVATDQVIC
jgi:hypothetical protein